MSVQIRQIDQVVSTHTRRFTNDMVNKYHHLWRILVNPNAYLNDQFGPVFWMTSADIRACLLLRLPYVRTASDRRLWYFAPHCHFLFPSCTQPTKRAYYLASRFSSKLKREKRQRRTKNGPISIIRGKVEA